MTHLAIMALCVFLVIDFVFMAGAIAMSGKISGLADEDLGMMDEEVMTRQ
jgi:hypothetical protein